MADTRGPDRRADGSAETNKARVGAFWEALYRRDWDAIGSFFGQDSEYTDVPSPDDDVARGRTSSWPGCAWVSSGSRATSTTSG